MEADKGLKKNGVGVLSSVVIGIASTAPAYSLAVTLGLIVIVAGIWAQVSPHFHTPVWGTVIYGVLSIVWYVDLTLLSQNVLADSIAALSLAIAFYYGINGFAVPLFYRHQVLKNWKKFVLLGVFPLVGGLALAWVFIASLDQLWYPADSASGTSWFGVGPPFVLGVGFILFGVVVMFLARRFAKRSKPFFDRTMETMVPWEESHEEVLACSLEDRPMAA